MTPETRVVFIGSAELACPSLEKLHVTPSLKVVGVVTQPERPSGRSLRPAACPIHVCAARLGIPALTPEKINAPDSLEELRALRPDVIVVMAYGQILRSAILDLPPLGCINLHASLLPSYRGAAPIQWAIARGETVTGVTTMFMNEGLDAGDIIFQAAEPIHPEDTSATLHDRLAYRGADLLVRTLHAVRAGTAPRRSQDSVGVATFAPRLKKADGWMDWRLPAVELCNRVRGFYPWPGCFLSLPWPTVRLVKVLQARVEPAVPSVAAPGTVLEAAGDGPLISTGQAALRLLQVQPEGKRPMSGAAFLCGYGLRATMVLPSS
jgi:methionyl-tRNA formyltransferase